MSATLEEVQRKMAEIGPLWRSDIRGHHRIVVEAYTPLVAAAPKTGIEVVRNLAYGAHPREKLDVFRGERGGAAAPVLLFVHGGAFVRGEKSLNGEIYDNVLYYFARHGLVGINVEFRLAPESPFPGGARDVGLAVDWVRTHVSSYGGDPGRLFLMGHSAGGSHVATYAFDPNVGASPGPEVAGLLFISGRVRADAHPDNPNADAVKAYFGDDPSLYEMRSPIHYAGRSRIPALVAIAEYENPYLDVYGAELFYRLSSAGGRSPRFIQVKGHNHTSIVAHLNTRDERFGLELLDFIAQAGR
jgi:acetyl esterase/lipase